MKIAAIGFKLYESSNLKLDQQQIMNLGAVGLQVGQLTESVLVEAQAPLVETATAQKSFVISSRKRSPSCR